MPSGFRVKFCVLMTAILVVGGCQPQSTHKMVYAVPSKNPERYTDAESLLNSEGYWDLVEEQTDVSPLEQHMNARVQVKPTQVKGARGYTHQGELPNEETHFRVLRIASTRVVLPTKKPVHKSKFMKVKPQLLGSSFVLNEKSTLAGIPAHKPVRIAKSEPNRASKPSFFERVSRRSDPKVVSVSSKKNPFVKVSSVVSTVTSIRLGEHPGKTRFVLDLTGPSEFVYELNNKKGYLLIDLPGTAWDTNMKKVFTAHALIKGYSVRSSSEGTKILVALKKPGRLITSVSLLPNATRGHRIYFDIGAAKG